MPDLVTLASLKKQIKERTDQTSSQFIGDSELLTYINGSYRELYDVLIQCTPDWNLAIADFTLTSDTLALPDNFYMLRGIDNLSAGVQGGIPMKKFNFADRAAGRRFAYYGDWRTMQYRVINNTILFSQGAGNTGNFSGISVRLWYVPVPADLVLDTDTIDAVNNWSEYIIVDVAMKIVTKEEQDASVYKFQKDQIKERIQSLATERDFTPEKVSLTRRD
jgi:hypothetical protein